MSSTNGLNHALRLTDDVSGVFQHIIRKGTLRVVMVDLDNCSGNFLAVADCGAKISGKVLIVAFYGGQHPSTTKFNPDDTVWNGNLVMVQSLTRAKNAADMALTFFSALLVEKMKNAGVPVPEINVISGDKAFDETVQQLKMFGAVTRFVSATENSMAHCLFDLDDAEVKPIDEERDETRMWREGDRPEDLAFDRAPPHVIVDAMVNELIAILQMEEKRPIAKQDLYHYIHQHFSARVWTASMSRPEHMLVLLERKNAVFCLLSGITYLPLITGGPIEGPKRSASPLPASTSGPVVHESRTSSQDIMSVPEWVSPGWAQGVPMSGLTASAPIPALPRPVPSTSLLPTPAFQPWNCSLNSLLSPRAPAPVPAPITPPEDFSGSDGTDGFDGWSLAPSESAFNPSMAREVPQLTFRQRLNEWCQGVFKAHPHYEVSGDNVEFYAVITRPFRTPKLKNPSRTKNEAKEKAAAYAWSKRSEIVEASKKLEALRDA